MDLKNRIEKLEELNRELEQKNKLLESQLLVDPLTGLPNRRAMDRLAERELRRRDRYPCSVALGLIDVDRLKEINHRYFLPAGDKVLADLAKVLTASMRSVDLVGRCGGDRFSVIAPETNLQDALLLGEHIRSNVQQATFAYLGETIPVRVSIGFAVTEDGVAIGYEQMKPIAAYALAKAKLSGRNRCFACSSQDPSIETPFTADDF
jgi:diguanylate cyclase (GGDEF)-like protein